MSRSFHRLLHLLATIPLLCCTLVGAATAIARGEEAPAPGNVPLEAGAQALQEGKALQGAVTLGEPAIFRMELPAARQVTIVLKKGGAPVTATVFGPDGEKVAGAGGSSAKGEEKIFFLAESPGPYRLEVRTFFKDKQPVPFELQVLEVREPTDKERGDFLQERTEGRCRARNWVDGQDNLLVNAILGSLADCMSIVAAKVAGSHPDAPQLADFTKAQVGFLTSRWHWGEPISATYRESLTLDFEALAQAARESDDAGAYAIMREVADDVRVKATHCSRSIRGLGADVAVNVTTRKGQKEDPGWVVYYVLRIYEFTKGRPAQRFPKLSSPTEVLLPPAKYLMWVGTPERPEGPQTQKQLIEVGEGKSRIDWDLFAP